MDFIEPTIVWHNGDTNETQVWFMDGSRLVRRGTVVGEDGGPAFVGLPWRIVGVGDMDGDGKGDVVWHNGDTNETQVWFMDGSRLVRRGTVVGEDGSPAFVGLPFSIVGAGLGNGFRLRMRDRIHQHYLESGGHGGPLGFPISEVQFSGRTATRQYRAGEVEAVKDQDGPLGVITQALKRRGVSVRFLGFRCISESDELSAGEEPYFVISVDHGIGVPLTKKFGPFENTDAGTERGIGELLVDGIPPDPLAIRVMAYENDEGDPDETAQQLQAKLVELAQQAQSIASASGADAADGPGLGASAAAGAAGLLAGPLGSLLAVGIVSTLGLGDDFIGQDVALAFTRPENTGTPASLGEFRGNSFNAKVDVDGGDEGHYELFFDILVTEVSPVTV